MMGMSTHAIGIRPPDERFQKMLEVHRSCRDAGIALPDEVAEFFDDAEPDPKGVHVEITAATTPHTDEAVEGLDIDISTLPPGVKIVRVYNSW